MVNVKAAVCSFSMSTLYLFNTKAAISRRNWVVFDTATTLGTTTNPYRIKNANNRGVKCRRLLVVWVLLVVLVVLWVVLWVL